MRTLPLIQLVVIAVLCMVVASHGAIAAQEVPERVTITGRCVDREDQPLAKVTVTVLARNIPYFATGDSIELGESKLIDGAKWKQVGKYLIFRDGRFRVRLPAVDPDHPTHHLAVGRARESHVEGSKIPKRTYLVVKTFEADGTKQEIDLGTIKLDQKAMDWLADEKK